MARLLDVLRNSQLTGTKEGCGEGECGACARARRRRLVNSCLMPVAAGEGTRDHDDRGRRADGDAARGAAGLHRARRRAMRHLHAGNGARRGRLCSSRNPRSQPTIEIRDGLAGNLCRCTGYMRIFESVSQRAR